ncbi:hypothetical protein GTO84_09830 (plasmid) [Ligilactobacillus salivarius]|uniref:hypothetical protein n=1 Tax=Ligilactobacillus salivarius TaxID=1624 RepID=UPI0015DF1235|nr:hypothetical protein [Ligilactobacillus salivarius]QLL72882.1 hypothetical protein GTO84_09830 [Ligilactobacillus salivarius]
MTVVLFLRLPHIWRDLWYVIRDVGWFVWKLTVWLFHASVHWWGWLHWLLPILTFVILALIVIGVILALATTFSLKAWQVFPDIVILLAVVAIILVFGPLAQHFLPWINLAWLLVTTVGRYSVVIGLKQQP